MPEPPLAALDKAVIADIYSSRTAYDRLVELCDSCGPRFAGTAGEQRAASLLTQWLTEAGLAEVRSEPFGYLGWRRGESRLEVVQPAAFPLAALALPHCPPGTIEAELCSVGGGEADDYRAAGVDDGRLQGQVVLCAAESSGPAGQPPSHRRLKYGRAVMAGAAAFLYYNQNPGGLAVTGSLATRKPAPIPGLGLAYEDGATLLRLLERGPVRVRLHVTAAFPEVESANILGDLPADPASPHGDDLVLASAHYDSHDIAPGALDNGTGVVIVLEAARAIAAAYRAAGRAPRRRLQFCFFAAEEIGLLGSWNYVSRHAAELSRLCFMLNVDDIGRSDPGAESLHLVGCPDLVPHFTAHAQAMHYPLAVHERLSTSSDHFPFVMHGIPAGLVENEASPESASGLVGRGWGHTIADTVDKVRPATVQSAAVVTARLLLRLAADDHWPGRQRPPAAVAAEFAASGRLAELRQSGRWPPPWSGNEGSESPNENRD